MDDRAKLGKKAAYTGIIGNILLTISNFTIGITAGSVALVAEAAHTLSDILTSIITFIGFKVGMKPADLEHPYGHGRAEAIAGLIIVLFLGIIAYEILSEAYKKLFIITTPPDYLAAAMALVGIIANSIMTHYMMSIGEKINSPAIIADAQHQKIDILSCTLILVGVIGSNLGLKFLDPLVAILIAIIVLKTAFDVGRENINNIMGKVPSRSIMAEIRRSAMSIKGVMGIHNVRINYFGPYAAVDLHIEVDGDMNLREAHCLAHKVEKKIIEDIDLIRIVNVHTCPFNEKY
ncbi:MAG: cation diffusion facilitator family transporter [Methanothermobacter sp.]|nr:cation diffusion facilitator family transporter [Methanobacteriales archaeon]MDI6881514.1 cation diffusion facilitator family transporter [Methanothermobacter sp.]MDX9693074.1 cation diffusion facilitator family transporter [Methanothermobacter sp.]